MMMLDLIARIRHTTLFVWLCAHSCMQPCERPCVQLRVQPRVQYVSRVLRPAHTHVRVCDVTHPKVGLLAVYFDLHRLRARQHSGLSMCQYGPASR